MHDTITDKRVLKTRNLIKSTVARMLGERDVQSISVSDVARSAVIQRATFYNHYSSVAEVVDDIFKDISSMSISRFSDLGFSSLKNAVPEIISRIRNIYMSLSEEYRYFLQSESASVSALVRKWFIENCIARLETAQHRLGEFERYSVYMYINGVCDAYKEWKKKRQQPDIREFIVYAQKVADFACDELGIN